MRILIQKYYKIIVLTILLSSICYSSKADDSFNVDTLISIRNSEGNSVARDYLMATYSINTIPHSRDELYALFFWCTLTGNLCDEDEGEKYYSEFIRTVDNNLSPLFTDDFKLTEELAGWLPSIYGRYASIKIKQNNYEDALDVLLSIKSWYDSAPDLKLNDEDYPEFLNVMINIMCRIKGEYVKAIPYLDESLDIFAKTFGTESFKYLDILYLKAVALRIQGSYIEAIPMILKVLDCCKKYDYLSAQTILDLETELDWMKMMASGATPDATEIPTERFALYNKLKGQELYFKNLLDESIPYLQTAIKSYEKLNFKDENYLDCFLLLGVIYRKQSNFKEAELYLRKGLLRVSVIPNIKSYYTRSFYHNLGLLYVLQGDNGLAQECFGKMDANKKISITQNDEWLQKSELEGLSLLGSGEVERANDIFNILLPVYKERFGSFSDEYLRLLYYKSMTLGIMGNINTAISFARKGTDLKDYFFANENIIGCYQKLLQFYACLGNLEKIQEIIPEAIQYISNSPQSKNDMSELYRLIGDGAYYNEYYNIALPYYEKFIVLGVLNDPVVYEDINNRCEEIKSRVINN